MVAELRHTTDLDLHATKQMVAAIGRTMVAMVVMKRHLWLNLSDIKDREKTFLLDALISPSGHFGEVTVGGVQEIYPVPIQFTSLNLQSS